MVRSPETESPLPEPDRVEGAPHPRETPRLYGQGAAETEFLDAFRQDRLHHGWLLTGPRGVGKATLAWRIARFLLATREDGGGLFRSALPDSLDVPAEDPVSRRVAALSEGRLFLLRRAMNERATGLSAVIGVEEVRNMKGFFNLSAADGGRRVVIVDSADEMNTQAANAMLKILEEPPPRATMLLVSHQPSRLPPTIRSRCRVLRLPPLGARDLQAALEAAGLRPDDPRAMAELSGGSVGEAVRLAQLDGLALYAEVVSLLSGLPRLDRPRSLALAERGAGRGAEPVFDLLLRLIDLALARLALTGATGLPPPEAAPGEAALLLRLAPDRGAAQVWADLAQRLSLRARRGRAVNLDPAALLVDMLLRIDETAGKLAPR
jgi:DNA polymerase-3 subunit delta'